MPVHSVQSIIRQLILIEISDSEDDMEEPEDTLLTKATIVDAVLSNISKEGTSSRDDSQDVSHLSE